MSVRSDIILSECDSVSSTIYFAAKDGHSIRLKATLIDIDKELKDFYINQRYEENDGQVFTPLGIAAKLGHSLVVKTILTNYNPDLEKENIVKYDGHLIHGATALWCAAGSGHLNIVKMLVKYGADVNHKAKTQSTPLRAACFEGRLDVVRYLVSQGANINLANAYNNTCLMMSSYKGYKNIVEYLLEEGSDPNVQTLCGGTALHFAAEYGHVEICEQLLNHGAVLKLNESGMNPVISAAERTQEKVVALFLDRTNLITKNEKIDALELMGASFANDKDNYNLSKALHYLNLAMELRYEDSNNIVKKTLCPAVPAYDNWIECQTIEDLQAIRLNNNSIHMEALTVRERILGRKCPEVAHPVIFRGAICADNGRFDKCEKLWLHALDLRQTNDLSIHRELLRFAQLFCQMIHMDISLHLKSILTVLEACLKELHRNRHKILNPGPKDDVEVISEEYEQNVITALYLVTIITKIIKKSNENLPKSDFKEICTLVFNLNQMHVRLRDGQTLLHLAVNGLTPIDDFHTDDVCRFPCVDTVKLLLKCGSSINAIDCDRNTPLHTLGSTTRYIDDNLITVVEEIIQRFIGAGVHFDSVNSDGLTAAQICTSSIIKGIMKQWEIQLTTLKCLAAKCIASQKIKYDGLLPKSLENYMKLHSVEKM